MSNCPKCGAKLSCGCQKRTLADGRQDCSNWAAKEAATTKHSVNTPAKAPTVNTNTWRPNRYLNLKKFTK